MLGGCAENLMHITHLDFSDVSIEGRGTVAELKDCVHLRTSEKGEEGSEGPSLPLPLLRCSQHPLPFHPFCPRAPGKPGDPGVPSFPGLPLRPKRKPNEEIHRAAR